MNHIVECDRCGWVGPETGMVEKIFDKKDTGLSGNLIRFFCPACDHYIYGQYEESYNKKKYLS